MDFFLISIVLLLTVPHISGLQCYSCDRDTDCTEMEICEEHQEQCSTTIMTVLSRPKISTYILKGCDVSGKPNNSISHLSGNQVVFLTEEYCDTELCNKRSPNVVDVLIARGRQRRTRECYSCTTADKTCSNSSLELMTCARLEEDCVDIISFTTELPAGEQRIKGCGQLSHCQASEPLGFHNQNSFHLIKCCNSSRCNSDMQDYKDAPLPLNGVTCFSCEGNSTHGCSPDAVSKIQCQGPMTQCLEASGIHGISGENSVVKGCASPSWCESPYTAVHKNLGAIHSRCCSGNLCNNWIINGTLKPSPRSQAGHTFQAQQTLLSTALLLSVTFLLCSGSS
ncbi:urokinase plasminogen activator surface receptor [Anolis carolinensis]|uniref:UPAR/Ly6 domain-containing protein n=1 Tax=Anolis carolinensis TaxID=28377 RepID=A0A803T107_ANOCA|nr:PREDICTED: urokinase plasminogen activator surface receptor [Anolis carolinensis]XP_016850278.1 PREDICTED: urokinase plasminogen activator surface receptor [Anolis carolinensis]|eukprot:XP_008111997.1 PREDICTED: urokinase plasminogen activator surface receptor [Anolis carolinensis]